MPARPCGAGGGHDERVAEALRGHAPAARTDRPGVRAGCWSSWRCVTTFDVVARKFGLQLPYTKLQELEWHFHAAIFSLWMGYCYTINAHPRVDSFTERLTLSQPGLDRARRLPRAGAALHARWSPTTASISSRAPTGSASSPTARSALTHRWIIKGIYAAGLWMVVLGILSVLLRVIVFLFGGKPEAGSQSADRPCRDGRLVRTGGHHRARLAGRPPRPDHVRVDVLLHFPRLPGGLHHGRAGDDLCADRRVARRVQDDRPLRRRAAHVGRRRRRSGARVDPDVHLHGRDPGAIRLGQGHAERDRGPAEVVPGRARGLGDGDGHDPGRADRRGRRGGDHAVGDRAAADAGGRLRQAACHRHHRVGRHARHPHSAGDHAGGDGGDAGDLGGQPVSRRHHAGLPAVRALPRLHRRGRDLQAGRGAQAAARLRAADPRASSGSRSGAACFR